MDLKLAFRLSFLVSVTAWSGQTCLVTGINTNGFVQDCRIDEFRRAVFDSVPTFSDAFNLNPSSLPTSPGKAVLEGVYSKKDSSVAGSDYQMGFIRGLERIGAGATMNPDNTFFDTSLVKKITSTQYAVEKESLLPTYNFGFAADPWERSMPIYKFFPHIGYAARINQNRGTVGHNLGASAGVKFFSVGVGYLQEPETEFVPFEKTFSLSGGISIPLFSLELTYLETKYRYRGLSVEGKAQQMMTNLSFNYKRFIGTYGFKKVKHLDTSTESLWMASLQYNVLSSLRVLGLFNYVPGASSVGLQWVL